MLQQLVNATKSARILVPCHNNWYMQQVSSWSGSLSQLLVYGTKSVHGLVPCYSNQYMLQSQFMTLLLVTTGICHKVSSCSGSLSQQPVNATVSNHALVPFHNNWYMPQSQFMLWFLVTITSKCYSISSCSHCLFINVTISDH